MGDALVDWGLAGRLARTVAGAGPREAPDAEALDRTCAEAWERVLAYTRMRPAGGPPPPEVIDRQQWADGALRTFRELAGDLDRHAAAAVRLPGPLAGAARGVLGAGAAAEAGTVVGLAARRVLGQYDVSLTNPERPARLLFVWPNLLDAERQLDAPRTPFLHWIALHETAHVAQFEATEWLRPHLGGIVRELIRTTVEDVDAGRLRSGAGRALRTDPRAFVGAFLRGELLRLLAGPRQRVLLDRAQATMAMLEGHAEHVMDAAAAELGPQFAALRARLEARREGRTGLEAVIGRLLGMEAKLRQYRLGKAFCDAVVAEGGIEALNRAWSSPAALPDLGELERPREWLERAGREERAAS